MKKVLRKNWGRYSKIARHLTLLFALVLTLSIKVYAADEIEPNNNAQSAPEIMLNTEYTGTITSDSDIDIYKINITEPGELSFSFNNDYRVYNSSCWNVELIGPNSTKFDEKQVYLNNTDTIKSKEFGVGQGTYYVKVSSGYYLGYNVNYYLTVNFKAGNEWEAEFNNKAETANELTSGVWKTANLYSSSDVDFFKITVPQKGKISYNFSNDSTEWSNSWNVELLGIADYKLHMTSIAGNNMDTFSSPEYGVSAGTYYLKVSGYMDKTNYRVKLNYSATEDWEAEPNDAAAQATEISVNSDIHGNLYQNSDDDYFKFTLTQPGQISLKFHHDYVDDTYSYYVRLIDAAGKELFNGQSTGKNLETLTSETYDVSAGTYSVIIDGWYLKNNPYTFRVDYSSSAAGASNFVTRLYEVCLGRTPEADGLNYWTNSLTSGEKKAVDIVQGVLCSQEYAGKGKSNGEVVNDCYQAMLGRGADEGGYANWTAQLDAGMSVNAIFAGFVGSEEFGNLCASYGIQPGTFALTEERDKNAGVTKFVSRLYTQALGRNYDVAGLNDWCGKINANPSRDNILNVSTDGFFHSQEFGNKGLDNTEFVKVLYRTFLGREYDDAGLADWVGQLDRGEKDRDGVTSGFANSPEFSNIMAQYGL